MCYLPPGSTAGSCQPIAPPPPDGGTGDASTPDASVDSPSCALYGQSCTMSSDCCNGVPCSFGGAVCATGQTGCTCTYIVQ
jgi:hypothetical protein